MILGSTPATEDPKIFAFGFNPYFFTASSLAKIKAAAPSFIPDAFPAVTVPSFLKAGRSFPNPSIEEVGLINSSVSKIFGSPFFCGISTFTISSASLPLS